ncbi:MAG: T9SS type A sorting domain-containing protein, partial [Flavobacteriales bacterium]
PKAVFFEGWNQVQVYPNPSQELTNISGLSDQVLSIELLNNSGQLVKEFSPQQASITQLDTGELRSGVYLIKIVYKNGTTDLKKLLVKH